VNYMHGSISPTVRLHPLVLQHVGRYITCLSFIFQHKVLSASVVLLSMWVASTEGPVTATQVSLHGRIYSRASSSAHISSHRPVVSIVHRTPDRSSRPTNAEVLSA